MILFVLLLYLLGFPMSAKQHAIRGPYKASMVSMGYCNKTSLPAARYPLISVNCKLSNRTGLIRGNFTIHKNNYTNVKLKMEMFLWEEGHWVLSWRVPGWSCDRKIVVTLLAISGVKYNKQKCSVSEGSYSLRNVNMDFFMHTWLQEAQYGKTLIRMEFVDKKNSVFCYHHEMLMASISPA